MAVRSPICVVVGHVDHGKSSILDYIRGTRIVSKEAGGITQAIGASIIPIETITKICGTLLTGMKFSIPGLLFIDTPGHAAFASLRKRGGTLADIAILVVDLNEGLKPQTIEAMHILKETKTPFIIAANKLDLVRGYKKQSPSVIKSITLQQEQVMTAIEQKLYMLVGAMHENGFNSERFDRVTDYTKEIAIVPTSAMTGEGMPELLMVITGLAQKYLEAKLHMEPVGPAVGTILEVKEEKGLGKTLDVIIFDGTLRTNDEIVIGGIDAPTATKVRVLLQPSTIADMRDKHAKFVQVKQVVAATGVKISAPHIENVVAGMPIRSVGSSTLEEVKQAVQKDVADVLIETDTDGVILKADTLGSVEALIHLCRHNSIPIRKATLGDINKKDIIDAESNFENNPLFSCILGFNVKSPIAPTDKVHIITSPIIYELIDKYTEWRDKLERVLTEKRALGLPKSGKILFLANHAFRQNNPAIIGVEVLGGCIYKGAQLIKADGSNAGTVKNIQMNKETISKAKYQDQVAVSIDGVVIGRQIHEKDILYVNLDEEQFRKLKEFKKQLEPHELEVLKEIAEIKRREQPLWGI